eukprot:IDg12682t1
MSSLASLRIEKMRESTDSMYSDISCAYERQSPHRACASLNLVKYTKSSSSFFPCFTNSSTAWCIAESVENVHSSQLAAEDQSSMENFGELPARIADSN